MLCPYKNHLRIYVVWVYFSSAAFPCYQFPCLSLPMSLWEDQDAQGVRCRPHQQVQQEALLALALTAEKACFWRRCSKTVAGPGPQRASTVHSGGHAWLKGRWSFELAAELGQGCRGESGSSGCWKDLSWYSPTSSSIVWIGVGMQRGPGQSSSPPSFSQQESPQAIMPGKLAESKSVSLPSPCERIRESEKDVAANQKNTCKVQSYSVSQISLRITWAVSFHRLGFLPKSPQSESPEIFLDVSLVLHLLCGTWGRFAEMVSLTLSRGKCSVLEISPYSWCLKLFSSSPQTLTHTLTGVQPGDYPFPLLALAHIDVQDQAHPNTPMKIELRIHVRNLISMCLSAYTQKRACFCACQYVPPC